MHKTVRNPANESGDSQWRMVSSGEWALHACNKTDRERERDEKTRILCCEVLLDVAEWGAQ